MTDSTQKSTDVSSCDLVPDVDREITMEDFLELEDEAQHENLVKRIHDPVKFVVPCAVFEAESPIPPDRSVNLGSHSGNPPARGLTRTIGLKTTESIFEALDSEELVFLRNLTFAKVLILDDNPPFFDAFGNFRTCEEVEDKQDNHKVKDMATRIKFACLSITSVVLRPSSHFPKIIPEHVELICDLDEFMAYPLRRRICRSNPTCYDVVVVTLEEKVNLNETDENEDPTVETLVRLISEGFVFKMEMFKGGLTAADIVRMCAEKQREKETKEKHDKENAA
ncbi:hypothetical protein HID58_066229 [Brassica napus]|uniref:Uncharacterized protein n=1 Tax=Brassica napus TaxID=3708 RepID=A0ABQ7ZF42_BRANA|nr:hypothetical protein HID58_066229 [Brassica napus]